MHPRSRLLVLVPVLLLAACGKPLWYVDVPPETVHQKMLDYPNDDTVTWLYAGNDGGSHHFVMKKASSWPHDGYRVSTDRLALRRAKKKGFDLDFPAPPSEWKPIGPKDLELEASMLEKAVTTPDRVREKMENLPDRSLDLDGGGGGGGGY